jgi:uncharacterized protein YjbJ (UPF0337 family)
MGITDKISGRAKQAAGDVTGNESLRREGAQEERKGEAKDELAKKQQEADAKAEEVEGLERRTDPGRLADDLTREELYEEARDLDVEGRSDMRKDELADEVRRRR